MEKVKIIISDCHLSAGRFFEGNTNPHEDFHYDDEMVDLFRYFSSGKYGLNMPVELIIAGDFLDFLNVPVEGEFEDNISEEIALLKLEAIIQGHPKVMRALREFASLPDKTIKYLIGNHDADLFFPKVVERITREWDPKGLFPSEKVELIADRDRISYPEGLEIRHGNQLEVGSQLEFEQPFIQYPNRKAVLNLPWSSVYVLKIINRLKLEREYLDKIRPIKVFILFGLVLDPIFTLKFVFLTSFYFLKTRIHLSLKNFPGFKTLFQLIRQETKLFLDLENEAREILDYSPQIKTLICGHTHRPMNKTYPDGKQYINTGSWVKMIDFDWRGFGRENHRTFALVHIKDNKIRCDLRQWVGEHNPHRVYEG